MSTPDDPDKDMRALFAESERDFADEPFVSATIARVEARHSRTVRVRVMLLKSAVVLGVAAASPLLIKGSSWLSGGLEDIFSSTGKLLDTPYGAAVAILCSLSIVVVLNRRRVL